MVLLTTVYFLLTILYLKYKGCTFQQLFTILTRRSMQFKSEFKPNQTALFFWTNRLQLLWDKRKYRGSDLWTFSRGSDWLPLHICSSGFQAWHIFLNNLGHAAKPAKETKWNINNVTLLKSGQQQIFVLLFCKRKV